MASCTNFPSSTVILITANGLTGSSAPDLTSTLSSSLPSCATTTEVSLYASRVKTAPELRFCKYSASGCGPSALGQLGKAVGVFHRRWRARGVNDCLSGTVCGTGGLGWRMPYTLLTRASPLGRPSDSAHSWSCRRTLSASSFETDRSQSMLRSSPVTARGSSKNFSRDP